MQAARAEAERIRTEAMAAYEAEKQRGFEEGRQDGAESAARLLAETSARADRHLAETDGQVVDLAIGVVQRVLGDFDVRQLTLKAVHHALVKQRQDQHLTLHVAPDMADELRAQISESFEQGVHHLITVEADPRLESDACRLASEVGFVDLGIEAQLRAIHRGLRDGLKRAVQD